MVMPDARPPVPTVNLDKKTASEIIEAAWRAGLIPADELLALPAPFTEDPQ